MKQSRHVFELLGKAKVEVVDNEINLVKESKLNYCPLWDKIRGFKSIKGKAKQQIEALMEEIGFCSEDRVIEASDKVVGFGATETFMTAMNKGYLDAVVTVCEGAGTVIISKPSLVQGIGGRLSGVIQTSIIEGIISKIENKGGVVLPKPEINQVKGVKYAKKLGFEKIGVTISDLNDAKTCKEIDDDVVNFGVHLTGISEKKANKIVEYLDLTSACASKSLRESAKEKANLQAGSAVPIFSFTQKGKEIVLERAKEVNKQLYLNTKKLPILSDFKQPNPLV